MNSLQLGKNTLRTEVTNVSPHGLWILNANNVEYFLPFEDYPWFKGRPIEDIFNIEEPRPGHYYWPNLDIDLSEDILSNPGKYPLQAKSNKNMKTDNSQER